MILRDVIPESQDMVAHEPLFKIFLFVCYNMEAKKVLRLKHLFFLLSYCLYQLFHTVIFLIMHQSFETPTTPYSGLSGAFTFYASESE